MPGLFIPEESVQYVYLLYTAEKYSNQEAKENAAKNQTESHEDTTSHISKLFEVGVRLKRIQRLESGFVV
eukprot:m.277313 g.277313  ORF g.277313 m.277313 type:complete len:70 (+) comp40608_c0_seq23:4687-4896(+)